MAVADTVPVGRVLLLRVAVGDCVEEGHGVGVTVPECEGLWLAEAQAVALPVGRGGEGVPELHAEPEWDSKGVPEMLAVALCVPVACWDAVPAATVGVPVPEAQWLGVREVEVEREGWVEAEKVLLLQGEGERVALVLAHSEEVPVAHALALWHRLTLGVGETVLQGLAATVMLRVPPLSRLPEAQKLLLWLPAALALPVRACTVRLGVREVLPVAVPVPQAVPAATLPLGVAQAQGVVDRVPVGQAVRLGEELWLGVLLLLLLLLWLLLAETVLLAEAALLAEAHKEEVSVLLSVGERV